jgi:hypothetical protein
MTMATAPSELMLPIVLDASSAHPQLCDLAMAIAPRKRGAPSFPGHMRVNSGGPTTHRGPGYWGSLRLSPCRAPSLRAPWVWGTDGRKIPALAPLTPCCYWARRGPRAGANLADLDRVPCRRPWASGSRAPSKDRALLSSSNRLGIPARPASRTSVGAEPVAFRYTRRPWPRDGTSAGA